MPVEFNLDFLASPEQQEIIECDAPLQVLVCGRRWGKTVTARNKIIKCAMSTDNAEVMYIAPTYRRSLKEFKIIYKVLKDYVVEHRRQPPAELYLDNGARISFLSFDRPDNMLGDPADLVVGDEAARVEGDAFWEVVQPMTADRDGKILLISTPRGEDNWFHETYQQALKSPLNEARAWLFPTPTGCMFQEASGAKRLERIRRTVPEYVWEQEYLCRFATNNSAVFRHLLQCIMRDEDRVETSPIPGCAYVQGLDLGDIVDHSTSVILNATQGHVVAAHRWPLNYTHQAIAADAAIKARQWNATTIADATGGASGGRFDSVIRFYQERIRDFKPFLWSPNANDYKKADVINWMAIEFQNKHCAIHPQFRELLSECRAYEFAHKGSTVTFSAPSGKHDDYVSALAMCLWARKKGWVSSGNAGSLARFLS